MLAAAGYAGEPIVVLDPVDSPILANVTAVTISQLRKIDVVVQPYTGDTATILARRASMNPPDRGGWHLFHALSLGLELDNPLTSFPLSSPCRVNASDTPPGWFGWPCDPDIEALRLSWAAATNEAERARIVTQLERAAARSLPFVPLGRIYTPIAYRRTVTGLPEMPVTVLWNTSVAG